MKNFFLVLTIFLFTSSSLFAEYRLEPVNCTLKKKDNCGAHLYNTKTGSTYFCNSTECKEILEAIEEVLTNIRKILISGNKSTQNVLPYLPLQGIDLKYKNKK